MYSAAASRVRYPAAIARPSGTMATTTAYMAGPGNGRTHSNPAYVRWWSGAR